MRLINKVLTEHGALKNKVVIIIPTIAAPSLAHRMKRLEPR